MIKTCEECGHDFEINDYRQRYCSRSCSTKSNNKKRYVENRCENCNALIPKGARYCSRDCQFEYRNKRYVENVLSTGCLDVDPRIAKRILIELRGHKCEVCEGTEWRNEPMPLVLDHIDGDASDNSIENLQLVCGNCNMQTPTFCGRNIGNGKRDYRKAAYKKARAGLQKSY